MDLMIDIETLSTHPNAIILNIGAIGFNAFSDEIYTQHSFYTRVDIDTQINRHELADTMEWWGNQNALAQEEAFGEDNRMLLSDALDNLATLARKCGRIWANGVAFDMPILEDAYREHNKAYPWKFWNILDSRTVCKLNPMKKLGNSHHALEDCVNQVILLQDSVKRLGVTKIG
jgi:hypothetical protein